SNRPAGAGDPGVLVRAQPGRARRRPVWRGRYPAALGSLVGGLELPSFGDVGGGSVLTIFDVGFVILGVGLITRRELARAVYVVFAVINLIFLTLGMIAVLGL